LDQAAARIQNLALWLWGIYTTLASVGFSLAAKEISWTATLFIASTSLALIFVYWGSVWVQIPVLGTFDPRSPPQIRRVYAQSIESKKRRLIFTKILSAVAAAMVASSLIIASFSKASVADETDFAGKITSFDHERLISVAARLKGVDTVAISIHPLDAPSQLSSTNLVLIPLKPNGIVQACVTVKGAAERFGVSLEWTNTTGSVVKVSKELRETKR
jgi:hypothetical protein